VFADGSPGLQGDPLAFTDFEKAGEGRRREDEGDAPPRPGVGPDEEGRAHQTPGNETEVEPPEVGRLPELAEDAEEVDEPDAQQPDDADRSQEQVPGAVPSNPICSSIADFSRSLSGWRFVPILSIHPEYPLRKRTERSPISTAWICCRPKVSNCRLGNQWGLLRSHRLRCGRLSP
jgi:hypothetical protein